MADELRKPPVNARDARTHWHALVAAAEKGERVIITRNGKPVATLVPIDEPDSDGSLETESP